MDFCVYGILRSKAFFSGDFWSVSRCNDKCTQRLRSLNILLSICCRMVKCLCGFFHIGMICGKYRLNPCFWLYTKTAVVSSHWTLTTSFHYCRLCNQLCVLAKRWQIIRLNPFTWFPCLCRKYLFLFYIIFRTTPQNPFFNVTNQSRRWFCYNKNAPMHLWSRHV